MNDREDKYLSDVIAYQKKVHDLVLAVDRVLMLAESYRESSCHNGKHSRLCVAMVDAEKLLDRINAYGMEERA